MAISTLEHYLSYHIRLLTPHILSTRVSVKLAYIFALISAVTAGFVSLISLYTQPWQERLHYTSLQINTIASMTTLGMYLTPPVLGFVADLHGPITLNFFAILGFIPCYSYLSYNFNSANSSDSFHKTLVCFVLIGVATSASYFSALLTCAKLYPKKKLLSISLPTTCCGLSSLLGSQLLSIKWFWYKNHEYLDLSKVFKFFSIIYFIVGILAWFATGIITILHHHVEHEEEEAQPLLSAVTSNQSQEITKMSQKQFFKDPVTYILGISMLLSLGPSEMFVANMSSLSNLLTKNVNTKMLSSQLLSVYSAFSTFTRLGTGILTDYFVERKISPKWILLSMLLASICSQLFIKVLTLQSNSTATPNLILLMGSLSGFAYGGLFTIYPTIILIVYGEELFGTAYGTMLVAPALGSTMACLLYASTYDTHCNNNSSTSSCITPVYQSTTISLALSLIVTLILLRAWKRRKVQL
ncbi:hypothetical protein Kpol_194p1 [Vanderwaltozyma polyspora DSM 70294]|uniref:Probable transporter MCH1 n=1 Tax=Vanderwaltozyma polyspora (strain ATCC 22028 / DSM 70294 / BCRC 21397 / CBS 2163 / NBRC 10782 / NRRL Y-8283 / UCD 57-17) TaxID=436907 RepID=A7TTP0_VANPO|nr:uncharacterized protein Kpol_194p1 [Vanderwaltozyma polyspora DSM 70294]EDO14365.1 hypothetical protein Kpol_194p1 [Vanderwaltozyma polyspora DSM 70294]